MLSCTQTDAVAYTHTVAHYGQGGGDDRASMIYCILPSTLFCDCQQGQMEGLCNHSTPPDCIQKSECLKRKACLLVAL